MDIFRIIARRRIEEAMLRGDLVNRALGRPGNRSRRLESMEREAGGRATDGERESAGG